MTQPKGLPPGVYVGLSMEAYHADPAIGSSGIKDLIENPLQYFENSPLNPRREEQKKSAAKEFGTAYHTLVLEPEKFAGAYKVKTGVDKTTVDGMIGEGDYNRALRMLEGIAPRHRRLLTEGIAEVSVFYRDERTGLMCKIRMDRFHPHWIADLKTTDDISSKALRYSFVDYGYDVSGAMYSIGAHELRKMIAAGYQMPAAFSPAFTEAFMAQEDQIFAFVYQGKKAPYISRAWCVTPWLAELGKEKYNKGLDIYLHAMATRWESSYPEIEDIDESMLSPAINYY